MQILSNAERRLPPIKAANVRVLLLTDRPEGETARRLTGIGAAFGVETEWHVALGVLTTDKVGFDLFVMECDGLGGMAAGETAVAALIAAEARMRVILVSDEFEVPTYPLGRRSVVCLPEWASEYDFRYGFDHALRDREKMTMM